MSCHAPGRPTTVVHRHYSVQVHLMAFFLAACIHNMANQQRMRHVKGRQLSSVGALAPAAGTGFALRGGRLPAAARSYADMPSIVAISS